MIILTLLNHFNSQVIKGVVHFYKKLLLIIYSPHVIQDIHVFLSSVEKNIMDFIGNQTVQGPNESFSAASNDTRRWI